MCVCVKAETAVRFPRWRLMVERFRRQGRNRYDRCVHRYTCRAAWRSRWRAECLIHWRDEKKRDNTVCVRMAKSKLYIVDLILKSKFHSQIKQITFFSNLPLKFRNILPAHSWTAN